MTQWNIAFKKLGHVYYYVTLAIGVEYSDIRGDKSIDETDI